MNVGGWSGQLVCRAARGNIPLHGLLLTWRAYVQSPKLPPHVTAATGIDAMVHAIESNASASPNNNPVSRALAVEALRLMGGALERAVKEPHDMAARGDMLLGSLLAGQAFSTTLTGDASLSGRPMKRVTAPLTSMGAHIDATAEGTAPLLIHGGATLDGIQYHMPVASAQVKSSLLLAGLYASGQTCVTEPAPTRDHTERMLSGMGYPLERDGARVCIEGGHRLRGISIDVPADISSAAFFLVGASIAPGSDLLLEHVGMNPTRTGVIDILQRMGADITVSNQRDVGGEPVADLRIQSAQLRGIDIPPELVPLAIDEFPAIFVAAACAQGRTLLTGAEELRVKESDRIQVMADGLQALGVNAQATADGMIIEGGDIGTGRVDSHGDHRIAMSFAMAALRAQGAIEISDCANVNTSFPGFVEQASRAGLQVEVL